MISMRIRLDALLVQKGLAPSRSSAQASVIAGEVYVNGIRAQKPGMPVEELAAIEIRTSRPAFVGRGGVKLDHALTAFGIAVDGLVALDVGSSTGGFTDCLLQRGASRVYAVDVGTGQLAWELRNDPRVISLERRDIRDVTPHDVPGPVDLAAVDVSFISLRKVLPAVRRLLTPGGTAVVLVKPQFEVGPKQAKRGVVRDPSVHRQVLAAAVDAAFSGGWTVVDVTPSPLPGPEGNLEFFLHLSNAPGPRPAVDVDSVVTRAHEAHKSGRAGKLEPA
jgi:23S rRNA (cytidine1920-2'-O)/16S rRNA (cytidine1409-2'-O)-methyltransferase